jgi:FkbM family methyltransferase
MRLSYINQLDFGESFKLSVVLLFYKATGKVPKMFETVRHLSAFKSLYERLTAEGCKIKKVKKNNLVKNFEIESIPFSVYLRRNSSDASVFNQILIELEYKPLIDFIYKHGEEGKIKTIIDAGANIGLTTIYLRRHFSHATLVSIEPDDDNFKILETNLTENKVENSYLLKAGVWENNSRLSIDRSFRDKQSWSISVKESAANSGDKNTLQGVTISEIIDRFGFDEISVLKMDIEGAERFLFTEEVAGTFLGKVKFLSLEIHDEYQCRTSIERVLEKYNFEYFQRGELTIAVNRNLVKNNLPN